MQTRNWKFLSCIAPTVVTVLIVSVSTIAGAQKLAGSGRAAAAAAPAGLHNWITPESSVDRSADAGRYAHTNWVFGGANGQIATADTAGPGPLPTTPHSETPTPIACFSQLPATT